MTRFRGRFRPYFRGRLHKRIFVWFGVSIAVTTAVVLRVWGYFGSPGGFAGAQHFLAGQFGEVWNDEPRRASLAQAVARDFGLTVRLTDPSDATLASYGGVCEKGAISTPITRGSEVLGRVHICDEHARSHARFLIPLFVAMAMLWAASGAIARRLLWPLYDITRVAQDIGKGQLQSRVRVSRRHGAEFQVLAQVMNEMAARIEQQLADQRALLATVSHEIRTPLSRMRLLIEFARQKIEAASERLGEEASSDELTRLEREVTEIDVLVSDLLASSRVDFTALRKTRLDAIEVAKTALGRASLDESLLRVANNDAHSPPVYFEGDATLVARAVANLLENAQRHAGGVDRLGVEVNAEQVAFVVCDRGPGFAPGEETRIFEPFYRGSAAASAEASGTREGGEQSVGLGLALVKKIAEAHQGQTFARNRADGGGGAEVGASFAR